jgi:hypothetical protein
MKRALLLKVRRTGILPISLICLGQLLDITSYGAEPAKGATPIGETPAAWRPTEGPLQTQWAKDVSPKNAHPEYPRPQMERKQWLNLNGLWDFSITGKDEARPETFSQQILVPFPVESALSGAMKTVTEVDRLWYRRTFEIPRDWKDQRVLLHFGAVDFETTVWVNGKQVGSHRGGYDPFTFDITEAVQRSGENEVVVAVLDPTDASTQPRGKQVRKPDKGIFYTATSGIWQTVWLEPVPRSYIRSLKLNTDLPQKALLVNVASSGASPGHSIEVEVLHAGRQVASAHGKSGRDLSVSIPEARLWSPEDPFLYDLKVTLREGRRTVDSVNSYAGLRKVALGKDEKGITRLFLNDQPYFMVGPLDQGFWPDGLYTAPTDEALRYDIEVTRKLGFNMARKHVKIEPARWYYWADKLGLLVWQDMPSGDKFIRARDADIQRTPESAAQFEIELRAMIDAHYNSPSIVMWVVFNEGWGQYDTARLANWVKGYDTTRLVNSVSGWADRSVGDVHDMHRYPGPGSPAPESTRAAVLGEFGGLGFKVDGHTWAGNTWGYRGMETLEKLTRQYGKLWRGIYDLKKSPGMSAAVYTQTTDVEYEGNGLLTYDRAVIKMPVNLVSNANQGRFPPEPKAIVLAPTAQSEPVTWRYVTERPGDDWFTAGFDDSMWKEAPGGFGSNGTPGAVVRTEWTTSDIWLRREFTLPETEFKDLQLLVHHDEDAEIYLNGVQAAKLARFTTDYEEAGITAEALKTLKPGRNVMAVHCRQTSGGQYIDAGILSYEPVGW